MILLPFFFVMTSYSVGVFPLLNIYSFRRSMEIILVVFLWTALIGLLVYLGFSSFHSRSEKLGETEDIEDESLENENPDSSHQKIPEEQAHIPYSIKRFEKEEMIQKSEEFYVFMNQRRSVRFFSSDPVPLEVIENCIRVAGFSLEENNLMEIGTAPSGAHTQVF